jgi:glycosyltransferase involved in cell wall biosynthesis
MRIAIVLHDLGLGGTQRLVAGLAGHLSSEGHETYVVTFDRADSSGFFEMDPAVKIRNLELAADSRGALDALSKNLVRIRRLRSELKKLQPALILSFLTTVNATVLLASLGLRVPVAVSEETEPSTAPLPRPWRWLRWLTYRLATRIVVHARGSAGYFGGSASGRVCVIPNPIEPCDTRASELDSPQIPDPTIFAMGRLSPEKGFDVLIEAFSRLADRCPAWQLVILGEGNQRAALEEMVAARGLSERVHLPGAVRTPGSFLRQGCFFVSSSRYEGFAIAIGEAMACGLPVIATDAPHGPRDLVRDGIDGLLVPVDDPEAMADSMLRLIEEPALRDALARAAPEVVERFSAARVWGAWRDLLGKAGAK